MVPVSALAALLVSHSVECSRVGRCYADSSWKPTSASYITATRALAASCSKSDLGLEDTRMAHSGSGTDLR